MRRIVQELVLGNAEVVDWFRAAVEHWEQCLSGIDEDDISAMKSVAAREQMWFERNCGGRWRGQEVMALAAIARLYETDDGFGDRRTLAVNLCTALEGSQCSVEVHGHARKVAKLYNLDEPE